VARALTSLVAPPKTIGGRGGVDNAARVSYPGSGREKGLRCLNCDEGATLLTLVPSPSGAKLTLLKRLLQESRELSSEELMLAVRWLAELEREGYEGDASNA